MTLAMRLLDDDTLDVDRWLAAWKEAARLLLRLILRYRDRCLVIDASDKEQPAEALQDHVGRWLGVPVHAIDVPAPHPDALAATIARAAVDRDTGVKRLQDELMACCDWPPGPVSPPADLVAPALERLRGLHAELRSLQQSLGQAAEELSDKRSEIATARAACDGLSEQLQIFEKEIGLLSGELEATRGPLSTLHGLQGEHDELAEQLHAVQEALEQALVTLRNSQPAEVQPQVEAATPRTPLERLPVQIGELRPAGQRDERPHREITWHMRAVDVLGRVVPSAEVRLVEHHGRPGLVIMAPRTDTPLLHGWQETGREDNRPYMLLVPGDPSGTAKLDALDSADWLVLLAISERIESELAQGSAKLQSTWGSLSRRLSAQLRELPARWRHGDVRVVEEHHGAGMAWQLSIADVHFGQRYLARMTMLWQPEGAGAGLALICTGEGAEPLLVWPDDERGDVPEQLWLPFGRHAKSNLAWRALPMEDRRFALEAARALPQVLSRAAPGSFPPVPSAQVWPVLARRVSWEAQRLLSNGGLPPVSLMRRAARRVLRAT